MDVEVRVLVKRHVNTFGVNVIEMLQKIVVAKNTSLARAMVPH